MLNHSLSAANNGFDVDLVGYAGNLPAAILRHPNIRPRFISTKLVDLLRRLPRVLYLVYAILRIIIQVIQLLWTLLISRRYDYIIIQNPPCMPLLAVAVLVRLFTCYRTKLVIDWHNYGFTIMRVNGVNRHIVSIARFYELWWGKYGDFHLTVSEAMRGDLIRMLPALARKPVHVLYDRATSKFKELTIREKAELFDRVSLKNMITEKSGTFRPNKDRPVLLLSSTSYTPDEDFMCMVRALDLYDASTEVPQIQVVVTGKGPQKAFYNQIFQERNSQWTKVNIRQAWLEIDDYPKIVAASDLGVCFHLSSSGFDLPMKVVDMFSAGLPCLAIGGYESLPELVRDGVNGKVFNTAQDLYNQLRQTLKGFHPETTTEDLRTWRKNLVIFKHKENSWEYQWEEVMMAQVFSNLKNH